MAEYTLFGNTPGPNTSGGDGTPVNLAHQITTNTDLWALGLRYYRGTTAITGTITGRLWQATAPGTGTALDGTDTTFTNTGTGWQEARFPTPIPLTPGNYKPTIRFPDQFPVTMGYWTTGGPGQDGLTNGPLTAPNTTNSLDGQGNFSTGPISTYPASNGNGNGYWVDMLVTDIDPSGGIEVADYNVAANEIGAHNITLPANTVVTVDFADDVPEVEIVNMSGSAAVYVTVDRSTPTVAGRNTYLLPAAIGGIELEPPTAGGTSVRLISSGTPTISVARSN